MTDKLLTAASVVEALADMAHDALRTWNQPYEHCERCGFVSKAIAAIQALPAATDGEVVVAEGIYDHLEGTVASDWDDAPNIEFNVTTEGLPELDGQRVEVVVRKVRG